MPGAPRWVRDKVKRPAGGSVPLWQWHRSPATTQNTTQTTTTKLHHHQNCMAVGITRKRVPTNPAFAHIKPKVDSHLTLRNLTRHSGKAPAPASTPVATAETPPAAPPPPLPTTCTSSAARTAMDSAKEGLEQMLLRVEQTTDAWQPQPCSYRSSEEQSKRPIKMTPMMMVSDDNDNDNDNEIESGGATTIPFAFNPEMLAPQQRKALLEMLLRDHQQHGQQAIIDMLTKATSPPPPPAPPSPQSTAKRTKAPDAIQSVLWPGGSPYYYGYNDNNDNANDDDYDDAIDSPPKSDASLSSHNFVPVPPMLTTKAPPMNEMKYGNDQLMKTGTGTGIGYLMDQALREREQMERDKRMISEWRAQHLTAAAAAADERQQCKQKTKRTKKKKHRRIVVLTDEEAEQIIDKAFAFCQDANEMKPMDDEIVQELLDSRRNRCHCCCNHHEEVKDDEAKEEHQQQVIEENQKETNENGNGNGNGNKKIEDEKPWKILVRVSDQLTNLLLDDLQNQYNESVDNMVNDFLTTETQM